MLSLELLALTLTLVSTATPVLSDHNHDVRDVHSHRSFKRSLGITSRDYVTPTTVLDSYDYIIAGGGLAGLVLASRLSENSNTTVLVLEAGDTGDAEAAKINSPGLTYYTSLIGTTYDYAYKTVTQPNAGSRIMNWPRGKVLGGSAAVNGMYLVRPGSTEIDTWHDIIATSDKAAAASWSWDSLLAAMKKGETFTPPTKDASDVAGMKFQASSHGTDGPLHASFPGYMVPMSSTWLPTLAAAGISTSADAYSGNNIGAFFATSAINPSNWTRSYSKSAYIDSLPARSNLHILANAAVTRITFADNVQAGDLLASGVEFATSKGGEVKTVQAGKEVILSGGAVGSPQILLLSGVGPRDVIEGVGLQTKVELPGVGQHLQDHLSIGVFWQTTEDTQGTIYNSNSDFSKSAEFLSFVNSGTAYVNGSYLFDGDASYSAFLSGIKDAFANTSATLIPSQSKEVAAGYKTIYDALTDKVYPDAGLVELLFSINAPGQVAVQAALQLPFSQGRLYINSTSVFDPPVIDPQYFSHPADITILRQGLKHARAIGATSPLKDILGTEVTPGPDVQSDADWENFIRTNANTEFHPAATCAMLPKDQGGVVDASLKVYGTLNVRVVDGSVFPLSLSAHLMAPIYGLAEKAAEIIVNPPSTSTTGTGTATGTGSASTSTKKSASVRVEVGRGVLGVVAGVVVGVLAGGLI